MDKYQLLWAVLNWAVTNPDQVAYVGLAASGLVTWVKKLRVSKHADRLTIVREAAKNAGGRILIEMAMRPKSEPLEVFVLRRIGEEATKQTAEFNTTGKKIDLTVEKMGDMILGQMGQNPLAAAQGLQLPTSIR
jgi:hypothetical protein